MVATKGGGWVVVWKKLGGTTAGSLPGIGTPGGTIQTKGESKRL